MGDRYQIGNVDNSAVALGRGAQATKTTSVQAEPDWDRLRHEVGRLLAGLQATSSDERLDAATRVEAMNAAVRAEVLQSEMKSQSPNREAVKSTWEKLRVSLAALGATGAAAFGADLAQIASSLGALP